MKTTITLTEPPVIEGECPSRHCRGNYVLTDTGQLPEHVSAGSGLRPYRCPCSGWLARNPHPRPYFYVQGVRFL